MGWGRCLCPDGRRNSAAGGVRTSFVHSRYTRALRNLRHQKTSVVCSAAHIASIADEISLLQHSLKQTSSIMRATQASIDAATTVTSLALSAVDKALDHHHKALAALEQPCKPTAARKRDGHHVSPFPCLFRQTGRLSVVVSRYRHRRSHHPPWTISWPIWTRRLLRGGQGPFQSLNGRTWMTCSICLWMELG